MAGGPVVEIDGIEPTVAQEDTGAPGNGAKETTYMALWLMPHWLIWVVIFVLGSLLVRKIWRRRHSTVEVDYSGYEEAETGVPHCDFEKTVDGFKVSFYRPSIKHISGGKHGGDNQLAHRLIGFEEETGGRAFDGSQLHKGWAGIEKFILGTGYYFWRGKRMGRRTMIEVTREAVFIEDASVIEQFRSTESGRRIEPGGRRKKLRRADFQGFTLFSSVGSKFGTLNFLGYIYGREKFRLGGAWHERHAQQVSIALNELIRATPSADSGKHVTTERLREKGSRRF